MTTVTSQDGPAVRTAPARDDGDDAGLDEPEHPVARQAAMTGTVKRGERCTPLRRHLGHLRLPACRPQRAGRSGWRTAISGDTHDRAHGSDAAMLILRDGQHTGSVGTPLQQ